jgi:hypothetical protein
VAHGPCRCRGPVPSCILILSFGYLFSLVFSDYDKRFQFSPNRTQARARTRRLTTQYCTQYCLRTPTVTLDAVNFSLSLCTTRLQYSVSYPVSYLFVICLSVESSALRMYRCLALHGLNVSCRGKDCLTLLIWCRRRSQRMYVSQ